MPKLKKAVALKYDQAKQNAPIVIASGYGPIAEQIIHLGEKLGIPVEVLWRRTKEEKGVSGSQIRQRILADEKWDDLVPKTVFDYVLSHGIDDRIKFSK